MEAKLIIVGGKANKGQVSLKLPTTIGRSREADLTIAHPMVSRRHCELFEEDGLLMVRDLGSLNGTIVRKERITKAEPIHPHEEFTVGPLTFRAEYEYAGEIAAPATSKAAAQLAVDGDEPPLDFLGLEDAPALEDNEPPAKRPATDDKPRDVAVGHAASKKKAAAAPAKTPAGKASKESPPAPAPPRLPDSPADEKLPESEPSPDIPEFPAGDAQKEAASDFALGPVSPQSAELDGLLADEPAGHGDDASPDLGQSSPSEPPAFEPPSFESPASEPPAFEPPSFEQEATANTPAPPAEKGGKSSDRSASKQKSASPAESASQPSSNGQKSEQPKEFSEEDLDEFFKDAL